MKLYFIGICGTAMGNAALMMRALGHDVSGSDENVYPPMSILLSDQGVKLFPGYLESHLQHKPDLVVVGNAMSRGNAEVEEMLNMRLPFNSLPELLKREVIQGKESIVITGTHGKTSTSSLMAWVFESAGLDPSFLIGGVPENFHQGFKANPESKHVILEGDEYDTAFFDKRSKFLHYLPTTLVVNNIEFDHADIFDSLDDIKLSFARCAKLVPRNGIIIANGDDKNVLDALEDAPAPLVTFGLDKNANWRADQIEYANDTSSFDVYDHGVRAARLTLPLLGEFNVRNALAVTIAARHHGISYEDIQSAFDSFRSIKRRLEKKGTYAGITIYDDFAHHPTAIRETLKALRQRHPKERVIAIFEPRSNTTRRNIFQEELVTCFDQADVVMLSQIARLELLPEDQRLNPTKVIEDIRARGKEAYYLPDADSIAKKAAEISKLGDVIIVMSNGSFGGIHEKLKAGLGG